MLNAFYFIVDSLVEYFRNVLQWLEWLCQKADKLVSTGYLEVFRAFYLFILFEMFQRNISDKECFKKN